MEYTTREENRIFVDQADLPLLRHYLRGVEWRESPLIERINPDRYCCVLFTHNPLEMWAAAGIEYAIRSLYNRCGGVPDEESREALRNCGRESDRLELEAAQ